MDRFLWIQIYDSNNEEVEYDNTVDTDWGISLASATLDRMIMEDELSFGKLMPNMFQVQIFGIDATLNGRKIVVRLDYVEEGYNLITDNNEWLVTENGDRLVTTAVDNPDTIIFTGYILTSTFDSSRTYRDLVCYDRAYTDNETNIVDFWNSYWANRTTTTLKALRTALLNYMGIDYIDRVLINDNLSLKNNFIATQNSIKFSEIIKMICKLQNCCPHINGVGKLEFIKLGDSSYDLTGNIEGLNSNWSDYVTDTITGVAIYSTGEALSQLVGTNDNVYKIIGNVLIADKTSSELTAIGNTILAELATINYTPMELNLIISDVYYKLGDLIQTPNGNAYIMQQYFTGSILIEENIKCNAISNKLSDYIDDESDLLANATKLAKVEHDVDEYSVDYADFKEHTQAQFAITSETIVLKVTTGSKIVQAQFGGDPSTGSEFKVKADNLKLSANDVFNIISGGTLNLTSKTIKISSTNFSVTSAGAITAKKGTIGGWSITTNALYNGMTSLSDTTHDGVWIGQSGIALGKGNFKVTKAGKLTSTSGTIAGWSITSTQFKRGGSSIGDGGLTFRSSSSATSGMMLTYNGLYVYGDALDFPVVFTDINGRITLNAEQLTVSGTKSRVVNTKDYGDRLLYCYETPTPLFGDVGEGTIAEDGKCYIWLEPVFTQTINNGNYQVFLQKYGNGECYVTERTKDYFIVEGDSGMRFGWELKARQLDYEMRRLDITDTIPTGIDYADEALNHITQIINESEVA